MGLAIQYDIRIKDVIVITIPANIPYKKYSILLLLLVLLVIPLGREFYLYYLYLVLIYLLSYL